MLNARSTSRSLVNSPRKQIRGSTQLIVQFSLRGDGFWDCIQKFLPNRAEKLALPMPLISVVMPVWNGEAFVGEAVQSLIDQTFSDWELIVVDDGSTDATPEIVTAFNDPRIRLHRLEHAGIVVALNHGLAEARAAWIARLDSDDISLPQRLERQWHAVQELRNVVLCHTNAELFGTGAKGLVRPYFPRSTALISLQLCAYCPIVHSTVLFSKAAVEAAGGYQLHERHAEDYALWGRLLNYGSVVGIAEKLVRFRVHAMSVSKQNLEKQVTLTEQIGREHCRRFMNLDELAAARAHAVLVSDPRVRSVREWMWFLSHCVPRLRTHSAELYAWLTAQTMRMFLPARLSSKPTGTECS